MQKQMDKELAGIDAALHRSAQAAKALADKNGLPYVVLQESKVEPPVAKKNTPQTQNK